MTVTVSLTITPAADFTPGAVYATAPQAAGATFDGSRLRKLGELAVTVLTLLAQFGVTKTPAPQEPGAANL